LSKEAVRRDPAAFLADDVDRARCSEIHTSGSTGTPLSVVASQTAVRSWYALFEARCRRWYQIKENDRWAMLGGQMVARPGRPRPPYWVWNRPMRQLYLSVYHLSSSTVADYVDAMHRHRIQYLLGYPTAIFELARGAREKGIRCPRLKVVISNAEPLLPEHRLVIEDMFRCPVRDSYGMAEMVSAAGECEHGRMHLWPEVGVVEVLDENDQPLPSGEIGRLVCTGLLNDAMPLVRYDVGDRGSLASPDEVCPCGRSLPILRTVEGRIDDVVMTPNGRRIGRLDTVFKASLPIRLAQIVQEEDGRLEVAVVPAPGYNGTAAQEIMRRLRERVGQLEIEVREVVDIPPGPAGKRRGVVSKMVGRGGSSG
jgi:phenylacetate-CoA ligase